MKRQFLLVVGLGLGCCALGSAGSAQQRQKAPAGEPDLHAYPQETYRGDQFLEDPRYAHALLDLNGDGRREAVVYMQARHFCGTGGCGIDVYQQRGRTWRRVAHTSIGWPPVRALRSRTNGWRDLALIVAGGGIIPGYEARLRFRSGSYPYNPSMPPAQQIRGEAAATTLIAREPRFRALYPSPRLNRSGR